MEQYKRRVLKVRVYFAGCLVLTSRWSHGHQEVGVREERSASNAATYSSDITAMVGTIFLWIMWPSFNGILATPSGRVRAITNTFLSLCASVIATFVVSLLTTKRHVLCCHFALKRALAFTHLCLLCFSLDMVHVQNSTLSGGVAMGAAASMYVEPGGAIGIGAFAGVVSGAIFPCVAWCLWVQVTVHPGS
jgi:Ammonium Transporter Family